MSVVSAIVASEIVRDDVALDDVLAELKNERRGSSAALAALLAENGHRAAVMDAACDHVGDDLAHDGGAVRVEELDGVADHRAEIASGVDPSREEAFDVGNLDAEAIAALEVARLLLLFEDLGAMLANLDDLMSSPRAGVPRD